MRDRRIRTSLLRQRGGEARVGFIELFFDLVFVFAVTQLSHHLLEHLSPEGAFRTLLLFLPVWWVWIYTSWITNWLDPERTPVRLMLMVLMLAGLILSTAIPTAFAESGLAFAAAYVFMQVGRSAFMLWALGSDSPVNARNFQRIIVWLTISGLFWIAGGLAEDGLRLSLWMIAVALEYSSPACGFYVPGLGRSATSDWDVEGGHLAERCGLFIIIALGESILVTGATFADLNWNGATIAAFVVAFIGSVAMWWIYFDTGARRGSEQIAHAVDPGRLARLVYTYVHLIIVAGIIVGAVADEIVLAHPSGHAELAAVAVILGGPALYLVGNILFKHAVAGRPPLSHLAGLAILVLLALAAFAMSPLALSAGTAAALVIVAAWERISLGRAVTPARSHPP